MPRTARWPTMVAEGRLGTVTAIRIVYACWLPANWAGDNWRIDPRRAGGGALIDLAPHGLDLAAYLLGERLVESPRWGRRGCIVTRSRTARC